MKTNRNHVSHFGPPIPPPTRHHRKMCCGRCLCLCASFGGFPRPPLFFRSLRNLQGLRVPSSQPRHFHKSVPDWIFQEKEPITTHPPQRAPTELATRSEASHFTERAAAHCTSDVAKIKIGASSWADETPKKPAPLNEAALLEEGSVTTVGAQHQGAKSIIFGMLGTTLPPRPENQIQNIPNHNVQRNARSDARRPGTMF